MKDSIILQGRIYEMYKACTAKIWPRRSNFEEMAKNNIVPSPVRLGNKCFYDSEAIESRILASCGINSTTKSLAICHSHSNASCVQE